jgi:hypothetical protein
MCLHLSSVSHAATLDKLIFIYLIIILFVVIYPFEAVNIIFNNSVCILKKTKHISNYNGQLVRAV